MGWAFRSTGSSVRRPATGHWVSRSELTGHPLSDVLPKTQPLRPMPACASPTRPDPAEEDLPSEQAGAFFSSFDPQARLEPPPAPQHCGRNEEDTRRPTERGESAGRIRWAALLQRVFDVDALHCPCCGATMRLVAAIEDPLIARRILECLGLPARAPPVSPASDETLGREPHEDDWHFDQSPVHEDS